MGKQDMIVVETDVQTLLELRAMVTQTQVGLELWGRDSGGYPKGGDAFWLPIEYKDRLLRAVEAFGREMEKV